jgi:ATP-dependent Clp endopeptidase proteolytic subunit ClpP
MMDGNSYIGKQIGNYHIVAELASGSFGRVFKGKHIIFTDEPDVAIKLLHVHIVSQQDRDQFIQEARLLKRLKHPYILPLIEAGIHEGSLYLVVEYAPNGSLRDRLERQLSVPLPANEVITILSQIGQALDFAHQQNIVHRDLKPENILFNAKGGALLADFGIAAILAIAKTKEIGFGGTPSYMAPEQFEGPVSTKSDQYALGCIAYELFTERKPFAVSHPTIEAMWYQHAKVQPAAPRQYNSFLPEYIEQAILKAISKQRNDRYDDISAFFTALRAPFSQTQAHISQANVPPISSPQIPNPPYTRNNREFQEAKNPLELSSRLLKERIVFVGAPIDEMVANHTIEKLLYLQSEDKAKDINLYINSSGGNIYSAIAIYDIMRCLKPRISTVCVGMAMGAAAILLAAGAHGARFAISNSRIGLIPLVSSDSEDEITALEIRRWNTRIREILARHTGRSPGRIAHDMERYLLMTSEAAKDYGIVDEVLAYQPKT